MAHDERPSSLPRPVPVFQVGYPLLISNSDSEQTRAIFAVCSLEDKSIHVLLRLTPSLLPVGTIRGTKFSAPPVLTPTSASSSSASVSCVPESDESGAVGHPYYNLSRLAVLKEYRQYRFGRALVEALHQWAISDVGAIANADANDAVRIVTHSQIPVKGFYAK